LKESSKYWEGWSKAEERLELGGLHENNLVHKGNVLKKIKMFTAGEKPNLFSLAEFIYFEIKIGQRNRWGYSRVASDLGWLLPDIEELDSLLVSYIKNSAYLSTEDILTVYSEVNNRHAAMSFLILATTHIGKKWLCLAKLKDYDSTNCSIFGKFYLSKYVSSELDGYIERSKSDGQPEDGYLILNHTMRNGTNYDQSSWLRLIDNGSYIRLIARSKLSTGIDAISHIKVMKQKKRFPPGSVTRYCRRPGKRT
jgi:hypothetical protein